MVHSTNVLTFGLSTNDRKKKRFSEAHSFHNSENYHSTNKEIAPYFIELSPYRSGALSHLRKKNMAGKLFFVFVKIRVPLVCTYVCCTKWSRNISLIHVKVR